MEVSDSRMSQGRKYNSKSMPAPGSRRRLTPGQCGLRIVGNLALSVMFTLAAIFLVKGHDGTEGLRRLGFALYGIFQIGQAYYWFDILRRIRRGEVAELVYPKEFRLRSGAETLLCRAGIFSHRRSRLALFDLGTPYRDATGIGSRSFPARIECRGVVGRSSRFHARGYGSQVAGGSLSNRIDSVRVCDRSGRSADSFRDAESAGGNAAKCGRAFLVDGHTGA